MKDYLVENKILYDIQYNLLTYFSYLVKLSLLFYIIGALNAKSAILLQINFYVKIFLGIFLMYRFSSRRTNQIKLTDLDRKIAYSSGLYIIVFSFSDLLASITETTREHVIKILQPYRNAIFTDTNELKIQF
jgi:hypothetical protein